MRRRPMPCSRSSWAMKSHPAANSSRTTRSTCNSWMCERDLVAGNAKAQRRQAMSKVRVPPDIEALATATVQAAFTVHKTLGPGLLESAYQECLAIELASAGVSTEREQLLPLRYRDRVIATAYRLDLIV